MADDQHLSYRADIDGLRAVAVLAVLGFHAYPNFITGGFIGVDIFFVISGFLISGIIFRSLEKRNFSFADFYSRRIRRIFPSLIFVLSTCLALGWFLLLTDEFMQLGKHTLAGAAFGPNFVYLKEAGYFDKAAELKPLLHLWSLGIEEQFYIVWPLLLVLIYRWIPAGLWPIALIATSSFALNIYLAYSKPTANFFLPITRCWELLLGALLAHISLRGSARLDALSASLAARLPARFTIVDVNSVAGVVLISLSVISLDRDSIFPGWWALLPTLGAFLIISAGPSAWINRTLLAHPVMVFIGLISYPLYLWHWPLLSFAHIVADGNPSVWQKTLLLGLSFILSWLTYRFWEKPFRENQAGWSVGALVLLIFTVGVTGRWIQKHHGLPNRFPKNIQSIVKFPYTYSYAKIYRSGVCFVDAKKRGVDAFSSECLEPAKSKAKKVFLWGDSLAAHLYPGLNHHENENLFRVIQFTAGGCPPLIDNEVAKRPQCKAINQRVLELIKETAPELVIMAGAWTVDAKAWNYTDLNRLSATIALLKTFGIKEIVLVGPVPDWPNSAHKSLVKFSQQNAWQTPPDRLPSGFRRETQDLDATIAGIASKHGIIYISPYHTFCNSDGCLAKLDNLPTAFDCCHFTEVASVFLITANLNKILTALGLPTSKSVRAAEAANQASIHGSTLPGPSAESSHLSVRPATFGIIKSPVVTGAAIFLTYFSLANRRK